MTGAGDVVALRTYLGVFLYPRSRGRVGRPGVLAPDVPGRRPAVRERFGRVGAAGRSLGLHAQRPRLRDAERRARTCRCTASSRPEGSIDAAGCGHEAPAVHRRIGRHRHRVVHVVDDRPARRGRGRRLARRRRTDRRWWPRWRRCRAVATGPAGPRAVQPPMVGSGSGDDERDRDDTPSSSG